MKDKVLFIGSYAQDAHDGQSLKTKTYLDIFNLEGINYIFVNTNDWKNNRFSILFSIIRNIRKTNIIFLMVSFRGARMLIPFINKIKKKRRFLYSMIGTGPLALHIRNLGWDAGNKFVVQHKYEGFSDRKMAKELKKLDLILPETDTIKSLYEDFYGLTNCVTIVNFRFFNSDLLSNQPKPKQPKRVIYLSRLVEEKGIFDVINAILSLNNEGINYQLDIYGQDHFDSNERQKFKHLIENKNISYMGPLNFDLVIPTISKYDIFCFPSRCPQEGMPGVIVESLIAGTPIISSNFPQALEILNDGEDSLFYDFCSLEDLIDKFKIIKNTSVFHKLCDGARRNGLKYSYGENKKLLLQCLFGKVK